MQKILGSTMIVAGTSIGIGMLTLPAFLAASGLVYGVFAILSVWLLMWGAALAFAELSWNLPVGTNMLKMSEATIGPYGKIIMCGSYILLLYTLTAVYLSSLTAITNYLTPGNDLLHSTNIFIWLAISAVVLNAKFKILDFTNRILMSIMLISFLGLIAVLSTTPSHVPNVLLLGDPINSVLAVPVLITSFGYQIVVPSIHKNLGLAAPKNLKLAILLGSLIPMLFYIIWLLVMMLQVDQITFTHMLSSGQPVALLPDYLANILKSTWVKPISMLLVCSAILTSLLGVLLSIFDFFKDSHYKNYALILTLMPPFLFIYFFPNQFILALRYSGYLVTILLIIFPVVMLHFYKLKHSSSHSFINNKLSILVGVLGIICLFL